MEQVLTADRPKSAKTALAALLVVVLIAAFAAAFYFMDGAGYVSGFASSLVSMLHPAASAPLLGSAPASSTTSPSGLSLPAGVDEAFAKRMYVEQLESEVNIQKLAAGKVAEFTMSAGTTVTGGFELPIRATFKDKTSGPGILGLASKQGKWFFVFIAGRSSGPTGGSADTVANDPSEGFASKGDKALSSKTVDKDVLNAIVSEQVRNQEILAAVVAGRYSTLKVDGVTPGPGTATLNVTLTGPNNASMKGRILCISKSIDGTNTWFVTSFSKT